MAELLPQIVDELPDAPSGEEVREQLNHSLKVRTEGEDKAAKGEESASEMARILRRLAAAMDRNPQSWNDLFESRRQGS